MPWTVDDPPRVALNWSDEERRRCVDAANAVLRAGGSDEEAIFACIHAAGKGGEGMEKKTYTGKLQLKASEDQPGAFEAVFATMNVVDLDGDVTIPGAFGTQMVMIEPWNHNYNLLPVGKGVVSEREAEAVVAGTFFMDTQGGKDHYQVVKALGDLQEWSYTFYILEAEYGLFDGKEVRYLRKMDVVGVGPVSRGAGVDTRTTVIKGKRPTSAEGQTGNGVPSGNGLGIKRAMLDLMELED